MNQARKRERGTPAARLVMLSGYGVLCTFLLLVFLPFVFFPTVDPLRVIRSTEYPVLVLLSLVALCTCSWVIRRFRWRGFAAMAVMGPVWAAHAGIRMLVDAVRLAVSGGWSNYDWPWEPRPKPLSVEMTAVFGLLTLVVGGGALLVMVAMARRAGAKARGVR